MLCNHLERLIHGIGCEFGCALGELNELLWREDDDWAYNLFPLSEPEGTFGPFSGLVRIWRDKAQDAYLPAWSDFDLMDFAGWWGMLAVFDVIEEQPFAFKVRLWGTKLVELGGFDLSGEVLAPSPDFKSQDKKQITRTDVEAWRETIDTRQICVANGPVNVQYVGIGELRYVCLPLADDGLTIDKLLYAEIATFRKSGS